MNCVLIDDERDLVALLSTVLQGAGHTVRAFTDPAAALSSLRADPAADLVITDVDMDGVDGFRVALRVTALLGNHPPRALLISGQDHRGRLASVSPSMVIGLVRKPFRLSAFMDLVQLLAETRHTCPGRLCVPCLGDGQPAARPVPNEVCLSPAYANCPWYDVGCGRRFQQWVSSRDDWARSA